MREGIKLINPGIIAILVQMILIKHANAHVSEQGIVLLLPTGTYIASGCLAVIFSMLIVTLLPHRRVFKIFATKRFSSRIPSLLIENQTIKDVLSMMSLIIIIGLLIIGIKGSRDPLTNLLPLMVWTFFWVLLFMLHCFIGNIWAWVNPWTGIWRRLAKDPDGLMSMPKKIGQWPAVFLFFTFYLFIIVDLAPDDPARLSKAVFGYICLNFMGIFLFGRIDWLRQVECFSVLFDLLSRLAPVQYDPMTKQFQLGLPGWKSLQSEDCSISQAFFLLTVLACGSFDGLNETFWWLAQIDINPLAFPGRSAVVLPSTLGMTGAVITVYAIFTAVILSSYWLVGKVNADKAIGKQEFSNLFNLMAITILPITAVYHGSHYYTSYLVNSQYLIAAISDPLANGSNLLGLKNFQVTTGYLAEISSVRNIWLTQAIMVVFGHILAVLMAHYFIAKVFILRKQAMVFHFPIAVFMAAYTWFGLWLLAAPKGA